MEDTSMTKAGQPSASPRPFDRYGFSVCLQNASPSRCGQL